MTIAVPVPPPLPTFREIADSLLAAGQREAMSLDALNVFALRDPSSVGLNTIRDVQIQCALFLDASQIFRALIPREAEIRAAMAGAQVMQLEEVAA